MILSGESMNEDIFKSKTCLSTLVANLFKKKNLGEMEGNLYLRVRWGELEVEMNLLGVLILN
jgi:hypothetical protein